MVFTWVFTRNFEKILTKMGNNPVGKKGKYPKVNTFLPIYPGWLKVKHFYFWQ